MPELAEVERARLSLKEAAEGKVIAGIVTRPDTIVYSGCTDEEVAKSVLGKRIKRVGRLGKYFYIVMQTAPHILCHLGMAGFTSTRGNEPLFYRKKAKNWKNDDGTDWPLRYWKFALKMDDGQEWCFCDSRRLGRIKLIDSGDKDITEVEPLSLLGRDPYLDMPSLDELSTALLKRKAPIKAVLLNQNGPLCGIGNWLVDEILFQARVHPAQRGNTLSTSQLLAIHTQIQEVVNTAVKVNADHALFPTHWLFKYRWGKGRRNEPATFTLPDGTLATVTHQTVGGRTSGIVESVQILVGDPAEEGSEGEEDALSNDGITPLKTKKAKAKGKKVSPSKTPKSSASKGKGKKRKVETSSEEEYDAGSQSDLTPLEGDDSDGEEEKPVIKVTSIRKKRMTNDGVKREETVAVIEPVTPSPKKKRGRKARAVKEEQEEEEGAA